LVGMLRGVGFSLGAGFIRGGWYQGTVPRSMWAAEPIEPRVSEQRFAEILRDHKAASQSLARAMTAFNEGDWNDSLEAAREVVRSDPNDGRAWLILGYAALRLERHGVAATALRNAIRRGHQPAYATGLLAMTLAALGENEQASELALSIEERWPIDTRALGN